MTLAVHFPVPKQTNLDREEAIKSTNRYLLGSSIIKKFGACVIVKILFLVAICPRKPEAKLKIGLCRLMNNIASGIHSLMGFYISECKMWNGDL